MRITTQKNFENAMEKDIINQQIVLAETYYQNSSIHKAIDLYREIIIAQENLFGIGHQSTAQSYNRLAEFLVIEGSSKEARVLYEKALHINIEVLGEYHHQTAKSYYDLGYFYFKKSKK